MRKFFVLLIVLFMNILSVSAANMPKNVVDYIKNEFPKAEIRFDGLVTIGSNIYLPLFPAKVITPETLEIKKTAPENKELKNFPEIVVFNNDFVLLKVISDNDGKKTVLFQEEPFEEVCTGLLPQDLLVPRGLIIPNNIKSIIGGLRIATAQELGMKVSSELVQKEHIKTSVKEDLVDTVKELKDKVFYIITCKSKNIHVVPSDKSSPEFALSMPSIPVDLKGYKNFLLVTAYDLNELNVISIADEEVIKTFDFEAQPDEIVIDYKNEKAYVTTPQNSSIYVIDLVTMNLKQRIQVNGMCSRVILSDDGTKIIYVDKKTNDVWAIELDNDYTIKEIGIFPNISAIAYAQNKIYLASRTKDRIAIIDYATLAEINEIEVSSKPVDLLVNKDYLYILSAQNNVLQVLDTTTDDVFETIYLNTNSFTTKINKLENSNIALITGARAGNYSILNLDEKQIIKTLPMNIPVGKLVITDKVEKINK